MEPVMELQEFSVSLRIFIDEGDRFVFIERLGGAGD